MSKQRQKFALVTGCGQGGIGEALIQEYARKGIHAIATVLPSERSDHLDGLTSVTWLTLDVTKDDSIRRLLDEISKLTGGYLDVLVNNAGICYTMTAIDTDVTCVQRMFDVNVFGPMRMVHHFHPMIIKAAGVIVNIGSVGGLCPYVYGCCYFLYTLYACGQLYTNAGEASYNATKAALHQWGNTLRLEMAPFDVRVLTVISGEIGTNILQNDRARELPEGSYFSPLAEDFKKHVQRKIDSTDRHEYAARVVSQSLSLRPPAWFFYGKTTPIVRFLETFGFRTAWDYILWFMFGFEKLRKAYQASTRI